MTRYSSFVGRVFILNAEYPVYDNDENVVGYTKKDDIAVVIYDNKDPKDLYLELSVATGEFAGYDGLALSLSDIKKAKAIIYGEESPVYVRNYRLA